MSLISETNKKQTENSKILLDKLKLQFPSLLFGKGADINQRSTNSFSSYPVKLLSTCYKKLSSWAGHIYLVKI